MSYSHLPPSFTSFNQIAALSLRQERSLKVSSDTEGHDSIHAHHEELTSGVPVQTAPSAVHQSVAVPDTITPSPSESGLHSGPRSDAFMEEDETEARNEDFDKRPGNAGPVLDDQQWLDPSLRDLSHITQPPSTIVNDARHMVNESLTHLQDDFDDDDVDEADDEQLPESGFPPHPPQTWDTYQSTSHSDRTEGFERSRRQRRPVASKEVVPIMARDKSWLSDSHTFLSESDFGLGWSKSISLWFDFKQGLPLADLSSVSTLAILLVVLNPRLLDTSSCHQDSATRAYAMAYKT